MSIFDPGVELADDEVMIEKFSISKIYLFFQLVVIDLFLFAAMFIFNFVSLSFNEYDFLGLGYG